MKFDFDRRMDRCFGRSRLAAAELQRLSLSKQAKQSCASLTRTDHAAKGFSMVNGGHRRRLFVFAGWSSIRHVDAWGEPEVDHLATLGDRLDDLRSQKRQPG